MTGWMDGKDDPQRTKPILLYKKILVGTLCVMHSCVKKHQNAIIRDPPVPHFFICQGKRSTYSFPFFIHPLSLSHSLALFHPCIHPSSYGTNLLQCTSSSIHPSSLCTHFFIHPPVIIMYPHLHPSIRHHYVSTSSSIHFSSIHHHHPGPSFVQVAAPSLVDWRSNGK